jgi:hypothetical protein
MRADYRIFLDSCVLANFGVCDLLLRLAERPRLIVPHWSPEVLAEVRRTHLGKLGWPPHLVNSFQEQVRRAFPEAEIVGYESLVAGLSNEAKDRHVLAAAIRGGCQLILTFNLKHFPPSTRPRFPVGEMDRLPASRTAPVGGARLHQPGPHLRFCGHRQDHRRPAPRRASRSHPF